MGRLSRVRGLMWERHRNPWSGWTRLGIGCGLGVAIWHHAWGLIAILVLAAATNPFWFPPPRTGRALMTRVVDGERRWIAGASWPEKAMILWIPGLGAIPLGWALWTNHPGWTAFFALVSLAHKAVFVWWVSRRGSGPGT